MPRILFWNVQRLSEGSPAEKAKEVGKVIRYAFEHWNVDACALCEVVSDTDLPVLNGLTVNKQLSVHKRDARADSAQLGYAYISPVSNIDLKKLEIESFSTYHGKVDKWKKGSGDFATASMRNVVWTGQGGFNVYVYHCNAKQAQDQLNEWVARACQHHAQNRPWILVGDFNIFPDKLRDNAFKYVHGHDSQLASAACYATEYDQRRDADPGFCIVYGTPTHHVRGDLRSTYDYAIGCGCPYLGVVTQPIHSLLDLACRKDYIPDHLPILVIFE